MIETKTIYEGFEGLLFKHGKIIRTLEPGQHRIFGFGYKVQVYETRPCSQILGGQEVFTRDSGALKISLTVKYQVVDVQKHYLTSSNRAYDYRYAVADPLSTASQIAVRNWAAARSFEEAMAERESVSNEVLTSLRLTGAERGIEVLEVSMLEFSPVGQLRTAYADLLKVQIEGQSALARARNEAATMRSLLNTARLVREHPGLLELRVLAAGQKPRINFSIGGIPLSNTPAPAEAPAESE